MATATTAADDVPESTSSQDHRENLNEWLSRLSYRMVVYIILTVLVFGQIVVVSQLYESDILTTGEQAFDFAYAMTGLLLSFLIMGEMLDGVKYAVVSAAGKHRAFLLVAAAVGIGLAWFWTTPENIPQSPEHATAYRQFAWVLAAALGLRFSGAGLYDSDYEWFRARLSRGESA